MNPFNKSFKAHLDLEKNQRILFSGPFGIGKSYFLNDYFSTKENKETFEVFNIYPVNFHISNNEDVVKLIKYQIIKLLIEKGFVDFDNIENQNWFKAVKSLGLKEMKKIAQLILGTVLSVGFSQLGLKERDLEQIRSLFLELQLEKQVVDSSFLKTKDFISETKSEWFAFDEDEFLTKFIKESLKNEKGAGKQKVLVIDDLDRLDPEHIFRILNIFSAFNKPHNHSQKVETDTNQENSVSESLFGFDKVILVADLHNLESVYHHKFGEKTDFQGYINKFYTSEPFFFDNNIIESEFDKMLDIPDLKNIKLHTLYIAILHKLIKFKHFNYRHVLRLREKLSNNASLVSMIFFTQSPQYMTYTSKLIFLTDILLEIYGTKNALARVIKKLKLEDFSEFLEYGNTLEIYFLGPLLFYKINKNSNDKKFTRIRYSLFGSDKEVEDREDEEGKERVQVLWNGDNGLNSIKIRSFSDIWDLYLNYLEAN